MEFDGRMVKKYTHSRGAGRMAFQDYFSKQSADYKQFRPQYPQALFEFIVSQCTERRVVLDCATGNGQAAVALVAFFEHVIGIDGSEAQLSHAHEHEKVEYRKASAESTGLPSHSVNCVTVAQALHWFDFDAFFKEVKRVVIPGGILAVWCYPIIHTSDKNIDLLLQAFYEKTMGPYWPPERHYIDAHYQNIEIPFDEIKAPLFSQVLHWTLDDLVGYLGTWSSVQKYKDQHNEDPVALLVEKQLLSAWGDPKSAKKFLFKFPMRIARL